MKEKKLNKETVEIELTEKETYCHYSGLPSPYAYEERNDKEQHEQNDFGGPNGHLGV